MEGLLLFSALLLIFFAGTEQACLLGCSCQLDGVIDCRDLGLTALQAEAEVVDGTIGTILASDNSLQTVNISRLSHWYPELKLLVLTNNAGLVCVDVLPGITVVGCPAELQTSQATFTTSTTTTTTTTTFTTTTTMASWTGVILPFNKDNSADAAHTVNEDTDEPQWKIIVYVAVGAASAIFFVVAFACATKHACQKSRKDPAVEFYSGRSLYNHNPVYVARLDETSSNGSDSFVN